MRILYVSADPGVPVLGHKGASVHVRELATALARAGASVTIASPRIEPAGDKLRTPLDLVPIPSVEAKSADRGAVVAMALEQTERLVAIASALRPDAVYERYSLFGGAGVEAARRLGVTHVLEVNAPLRDEAARFRTLPHPELAAELERRVFACTDRIFVVSEELGDLLRRNGTPPSKLEVLANAVAPEHFPLAERPAGGELTVGFAGSLKPWHGVDVLLEAARLACAAEARLRFEIVGGGPLAVLLDAVDLPPERFCRHGVLPHVEAIAILRRWHIGVAPYLPVGDFYFSPLKVLEYMAGGACVVASDLGQIRTLLAGGERGVLVEPGDPVALAEALVRLARTPERVTELGARAREYVLASHTWEGNAGRVLEALAACGRQAAA